jgi:hypothetical protein
VLQMMGQGGLGAMKGAMRRPMSQGAPQGGLGQAAFAGMKKQRKKGGPWGLIKAR